MKTFGPAFAAHISSGATTLVTCWRLERRDGLVLGFTDHDRTLAFDGTVYSPMTGFDGGEVAAKLGPAVATSDVIGALDSAEINENDIRLGRYDGATVETWRVNWRDPSQRALMRRDIFGEIKRIDGMFRAELRSAQYQMNVANGRRYQAICGTELGTAQCGIDLELPAYNSTGTVLDMVGKTGVRVSGLTAFSDKWFVTGTLTWSDGARTGVADRIAAQDRQGAEDFLYFGQEIADWVAPGDGFALVAGCDRQFATCKNKFANQINFRGFPHIPGNDFVLSYPKQGDALKGAPLVE